MLNGRESDRLLENAGESVEYVKQYVQQQIKLTKLNVAESAATSISGIVTGIALGTIGLIALMFLSVAAACFIGEALDDSYGLGFLAVFVFYALIFALIYFMRRKWITNPAVSGVIRAFFPPPPADEERQLRGTQSNSNNN